MHAFRMRVFLVSVCESIQDASFCIVQFFFSANQWYPAMSRRHVMVKIKPYLKVFLIAKDVIVLSGALIKPGDFVNVKLSRGAVNSYVFGLTQKTVAYSMAIWLQCVSPQEISHLCYGRHGHAKIQLDMLYIQKRDACPVQWYFITFVAYGILDRTQWPPSNDSGGIGWRIREVCF